MRSKGPRDLFSESLERAGKSGTYSSSIVQTLNAVPAATRSAVIELFVTLLDWRRNQDD